MSSASLNPLYPSGTVGSGVTASNARVTTTASLGASNVPGDSIRSSYTSVPVSLTTSPSQSVHIRTITVTVPPSGTALAASSGMGSTDKNAMAIGLGVGLGGAAILAIIGLLFVRRYRAGKRASFEKRTEGLKNMPEMQSA